MKHIAAPFTLPNGAVLKNRIAKSAMSENFGTRRHAPSKGLIHAYRVWAKGNPGLLITGNIMVDSMALGEARNVVVEDYKDFALLKQWAKSVAGTGLHLWPQINHPGRQAFAAINREIVAPSAVPLKMGGASKMFKVPTALTEEAIWDIIKRFGTTARIMKEAGFTGCQIHGAHGYLVSQFLSPNSNIRTDQWGGSLANRARFVLEIYREIRRQVGAAYPIGIKINSADFQRGGFTEEASMEVVRLLGNEGIDLIEISGGTYEQPKLLGLSGMEEEEKQNVAESTLMREAYFVDFAVAMGEKVNVPLMVTGGFRQRAAMEQALQSGSADVIGLGRPMCVMTDAPNQLINGLDELPRYEDSLSLFPKWLAWLGNLKMLKAVAGFAVQYWYYGQIDAIGRTGNANAKLTVFQATKQTMALQKKLTR